MLSGKRFSQISQFYILSTKLIFMSVSVLCQFFFFGKCVAAVTIKIYRYDSHIDRHERLKMAFPF